MIKLGIIGNGRIAKRFLSDAWQGTSICPTVLYNPRVESALSFIETYKFDNLQVTDHWEAFLSKTDAIYIASPHGTHVPYTRRLLQAGKHVLCEKPMAFCQEDAQDLFAIAEEHGCILMEALKTLYCPGYEKLIQIANSGIIGEVCDIEACFTKLIDQQMREFADPLYGGSFVELGTYGMLPILQLLGTNYKKIEFSSLFNEFGKDKYTKAHLMYKEGMGLAKVGLGVKSEGQLIIAGTKGYILVQAPWWQTKHFEVRYEDANEIDSYDYPYEGSGLCYELMAFEKRIIQNNGEYEQHRALSIGLAIGMEKFLMKRN